MNQLWYLPYESSDLVNKYFAEYLRRLVAARENARNGGNHEGRFIRAAYAPEALERRLQQIEHLGLTQKVLTEVGDIGDPIELDRRLMDVWAELRTLDQLLREGYTDIEKVTKIADFTACRDNQKMAFQVTHLQKPLSAEIDRPIIQISEVILPLGWLDVSMSDLTTRLGTCSGAESNSVSLFL